jgi:hypothetical protein
VEPLIDSFGLILGEDQADDSTCDDRILNLGLHHHLSGEVGHDVIIEAWWRSM